MKIKAIPLAGAYEIDMAFAQDARGIFIKTFNCVQLKDAGIEFNLQESYYSTSHQNVIRGMHFQLPPHQHSKIVFCPCGSIIDVILDLRIQSSTYGMFHTIEMNEHNHKAVYIPEGFAHGFKALTDDAMTYYLVSSVYDKEHDTGILYNSFGYDWEIPKPIISLRDLSFLSLANFDSPF